MGITSRYNKLNRMSLVGIKCNLNMEGVVFMLTGIFACLWYVLEHIFVPCQQLDLSGFLLEVFRFHPMLKQVLLCWLAEVGCEGCQSQSYCDG